MGATKEEIMGIDSVKAQFQSKGWNLSIKQFEVSTATVGEAAEALGVEPGMIAKTMALRLPDRDIILVAKGDTRLDNKKCKAVFGSKARMISLDEVEAVTGHPVGGVCPFGLIRPLAIYLDESLKVYEVVYPAGGTANSAVRIAPEELGKITGGEWVNVCQ